LSLPHISAISKQKPFSIFFLFVTDVERLSTPDDHLETSKHSSLKVFQPTLCAIQNHIINFLHQQAAVQHHVQEEDFNTINLHASKFVME
jgi:hypothetical protein